MKESQVISPFKNFITNAKFKIKANSPMLLVATGLISAGVCVVTACVSTIKAKPIIVEHNLERERIDKSKKFIEWAEQSEVTKVSEDKLKETEASIKKDTLALYGKTTWELAKVYSIPIASASLSVISILSGCHILKARNAALAAAYLALNKSYKSYRKRVAERFGKDVEHQIRSGATTNSKVDEKGDAPETSEDNGIVKINGFVGPNGFSEYARVFDEASCLWEKSAEINFRTLILKQDYWNNVLRSRRIHTKKYGDIGIVFLNEVLKDLNLRLSESGQYVGWTYFPDGNNPFGDDYIDFGIFDVWRPKCADFINGYERNIVLDFNVDGVVSDIL